MNVFRRVFGFAAMMAVEALALSSCVGQGDPLARGYGFDLQTGEVELAYRVPRKTFSLSEDIPIAISFGHMEEWSTLVAMAQARLFWNCVPIRRRRRFRKLRSLHHTDRRIQDRRIRLSEQPLHRKDLHLYGELRYPRMDFSGRARGRRLYRIYYLFVSRASRLGRPREPDRRLGQERVCLRTHNIQVYRRKYGGIPVNAGRRFDLSFDGLGIRWSEQLFKH